MILNEGKRIIVMVWVLVAASCAAGILTIGLFGWHVANVRNDRVLLIDRGRELARDYDKIVRLASVIQFGFDELLDSDASHSQNERPIEEFQKFMQEKLDSKSEAGLTLILRGLTNASSKLKKIWDQSITWESQYKDVLIDFRQKRTLKKVLKLIKDLDDAITTSEGQRRIENAILYRRWRAAQGAEASLLAQMILEREVDHETKNFGAIIAELEEVARYVEALAGEDQLDNLVDIKDNQLKASLERLKRNVAGLVKIDDAYARVGPATLEAIYIALFGKGYTIDKSHQTVLVGQGGLYSLRHDLLRLIQERNELKKKVERAMAAFGLFKDRFSLLKQAYATTHAVAIEKKLSRGLTYLLLVTGATFFALLGLAFVISRLIRRQVNAIEEARAAEYASNQTTQRLLAEQKLSAEAIAKLHRDKQLILDSAGEGIYGIDLEGNATFVNPAGAKMLGYAVEELVGLPTHATVHHTRPDGTPYPKAECPMYAAFQDGNVHQVETDVLWRKDGTSFPVQYTSTPIWEDNKVAGVVVTFQDITERKYTETAMQEAKLAAEKANRAKSDFLASMSHELRTPLNGILGYTQILKRDPNLAEKHKSGVEVIQRCGDHLLTLINDILDLSKIEAQKLEIHPTEFSLPECLQQIVHIIRIRAEQAGLAFVYDMDQDLPNVVRGDEKLLRQILFNLLSNAVKYTDKGEVALRVDYTKESKTNGTLGVQVEDTGRGIPAEQLEEIFLPFQQVGEHTRQQEGTGLGLAITKNLIALMGGTLDVNSTVGKGSTFRLTLPLPTVQMEIPERPQSDRTIVGFKGAPKRILVVDDKFENRAIISNLLTPLGFEVSEAADGREGLAKAQEERPDLIVMDLIMPDMDGLEATRRIRKSTELKDVPVIGSSASVFEFNRQDAISAGCADFLPKPLKADDLFEILRVRLNLEWEYATENVPRDSMQKEIRPLVPPPREELTALLKLAKVGKIMAIRQQIRRMEELGVEYMPFVEELRRIVKRFDMEQLTKFLLKYAETPE